ncbi:hypothetical protein ACMAZF_12680 [Psychrobium sp. nBUS_13]|uniref:hypothetical protein n=1 Tax=Psychrobium sp. nBUS_13 TaxID=3395319 RepID=UPI003EBE4892
MDKKRDPKTSIIWDALLLLKANGQSFIHSSNRNMAKAYSSTKVGLFLQLVSVEQYNRNWRNDMNRLTNTPLRRFSR